MEKYFNIDVTGTMKSIKQLQGKRNRHYSCSEGYSIWSSRARQISTQDLICLALQWDCHSWCGIKTCGGQNVKPLEMFFLWKKYVLDDRKLPCLFPWFKFGHPVDTAYPSLMCMQVILSSGLAQDRNRFESVGCLKPFPKKIYPRVT